MSDWNPGDYAYIEIKGKIHLAEVLATSNSSRRENNYDLVQLRLYRKRRDGNNQVEIIPEDYPEPVQSYRLHRTGATPEQLPDPPARVGLADYWQQPAKAQNEWIEAAQPQMRQGRGCMIVVGDQVIVDGKQMK